MNIRQSDLLLSLKEVQKFLDEHSATLTGIGRSGTRKRLDTAVARLSEAAAVQSGSGLAAKSATSRKNVLVRELRDEHMWPIARLAAVELSPLPELTSLVMPKGNVSGERLVALARGMAAEAGKHEGTFITAGLPADFLAQLTAAADAVGAEISTRKQSQGQRGGATTVLEKELKHARSIIKALDVCIRKEAKKDTALLGSWRIVKRFRQPVGKSRATVPADSQSGTPAATA